MKLDLAQIEDQRMKLNRFSEEPIIAIMKEQGARIAVTELFRKHGVGEAKLRPRQKFGLTNLQWRAAGLNDPASLSTESGLNCLAGTGGLPS